MGWAPSTAGSSFIWVAEKLEKLKIEQSTWDADRTTPVLEFLKEQQEKYYAELDKIIQARQAEIFGFQIPLPDAFVDFVANLKEVSKIIFDAINNAIDLFGGYIEYYFAIISGVINGLIDMIAGLLQFIGWILKAMGGSVEGMGEAVSNADYYYPLLLEYIDNFFQAVRQVNWKEVFTGLKGWFKKIVDAIEVKAILATASINHRQVGYYIGYIAINILGCFTGVAEIAAITRLNKLQGPLRQLMEYVTAAVGKLPAAAKLTVQTVFTVLRQYITLIAQGTKAVMGLIDKIFEAVMKWVLTISGKIAREVFLLVLASGKTLACSLVPLELVFVILGRLLSARVKSNLSKLGVKIFEREGMYYVQYNKQIIFAGDKEVMRKFTADTLDKDEPEAKKFLEELAALSKKKVQLKLRGSTVELKEFRWIRFQYAKRVAAETAKLRNAFDNGIRQKFLKNLATDSNIKSRLQDAGLSDLDLKDMVDGLVPDGWNVHHRYSIDDSGSNDFNNFILIKNEPFHKAITGHQNRVCKKIGIGESELVEWPIFEDFVYP